MARKIIVALGFAAALAQPAAAHDPGKALQPIELTTLIADALPPAGSKSLTWDHMQEAPIHWLTDGVSGTANGGSQREGLARVRVGGRVVTKLRRTRVEVPWTVDLRTDGNAKFGPTEVEIQPGAPDDPCFGTLFSNCSWRPEVILNRSALQAHLVCRSGPIGNDVIVYRISTPGRRPGYLSLSYSEGSGGGSMWIDVSPADGAAPDCQGGK